MHRVPALRVSFPRFSCTFSDFGLRPFLMQSDLSVENVRFRLKPKSSFLIQPKKGFFNSLYFY